MQNISFFLVLFVLLFSNTAKAQSDNHVQKDIFNVTFELGGARFIGDFAKHLSKDGAYLYTPTLDLTLSIFFTPALGVQWLMGNASVIHSESEPMEGTLLYNGLEFFAQKALTNSAYYKFFTGVGFQHASMSLEWYSSGFFELGSGFGFVLNEHNALFFSIKFRMSILPSEVIYKHYPSLNGTNDNLMFVSLNIGFVFKVQ